VPFLGCVSSDFWVSSCLPATEQRGALVKMFVSRRRAPGSIPESGVLWHISGCFVARLDFVSFLRCLSSDFWISRCSTVAEQRGALVKMFDSRRRVPGSIPEVGVFWHISEFFVARLDFVPLLGGVSSDFWVF